MSQQLDHLVSFPLQKFSYVTTTTINGKFLWSHLSQPGLVVTFGNAAYSLQALQILEKVLRIYNGSQLLDNITLKTLREHIQKDELAFATQNLPDSARRVLILEKKPFIAIRYPLPTGQTRRIQMNFSLGSDFDKALEILQKSGLTVRHKELDPKPLVTDAQPINLTVTDVDRPLPSSQPLTNTYSQPRSISAFFQNSQTDSYGLGPSSQTSQWIGTEPSNYLLPTIGPSLVESVSAQHFQPPPSSQPTAATSSNLQQSGIPRYNSYMPAQYRYHIQEQQIARRAQPEELDPLRRSLFQPFRSHDEDVVRPTTAPPELDVLGPIVPPKRDLPFAKPPSRPATSASTKNKSRGQKRAKDQQQKVTTIDQNSGSVQLATASVEEDQVNRSKTAPKRKRSTTSTTDRNVIRESPGAVALLPSPAPVPRSSSNKLEQSKSTWTNVNSTDEPVAKKPRAMTRASSTASKGNQISTSETIAIKPTIEEPEQLELESGSIKAAHPPTVSRRFSVPRKIIETRLSTAPEKFSAARQESIITESDHSTIDLAAPIRARKSAPVVVLSRSLQAAKEKAAVSSAHPESRPVAVQDWQTVKQLATLREEAQLELPKTKDVEGQPSAVVTQAASQVDSIQVTPKPDAPKRKRPSKKTKPSFSSAGVQTTPTLDRSGHVEHAEPEPIPAIKAISGASSSEATAVVAPLSSTAHSEPIAPAMPNPSSLEAPQPAPLRFSAPIEARLSQADTPVTASVPSPAAEQPISGRVRAAAPPPSALDVSFDWQTTVEAFVLHHRARVLPTIPAASSVSDPPPALVSNLTMSDFAGPATPVTAQQTLFDEARVVQNALCEPRDYKSLERLVATCLQAPGFEAMCADVESVWRRIVPNAAAVGVEMDL